MRSAVLAAALLIAASAQAQTPAHTGVVRALTAGQPYKAAVRALDADHDRWVKDIIAITEIPAPPFKEEARAKAFADMLRQAGLKDVRIDEEGNVLALRPGVSSTPGAGRHVVVVSAHLDTVFPEGTPVKVRREGDRLHAPGVGDDSTGLATLLTLARAMNAGKVDTADDILFVGTVGEEGLGDLRGVRHLFTDGAYKGRIKAFFSLDGSGLGHIVDQGTGSKRYRVTFKGPGGHSYGAFGIVSPSAALGRAVEQFYRTEVPADPKTTYSVSVLGGGTSVNAIPNEVWMEVDMRSADAAELARLEKRFLQIVDEAVAAENKARSTRSGSVSAERKVIGDRPAGRTAADADILQYALAVHQLQGVKASRSASSTDANVPMSLNVPALTIARNAQGDRAHALDEWVSVEKAPNMQVKTAALATVLAVAGAR